VSATFLAEGEKAQRRPFGAVRQDADVLHDRSQRFRVTGGADQSESTSIACGSGSAGARRLWWPGATVLAVLLAVAGCTAPGHGAPASGSGHSLSGPGSAYADVWIRVIKRQSCAIAGLQITSSILDIVL
jgi:hypothetical protein